jgi:hypothetical protein
VTGYGLKYEKTDVTAGSVVRVGIVIAVVSILTSVVALWLLRYFAAAEARQDPPPPPMAWREGERRAPEPRLQEQPTADVEVLRREEARLLATYGWVDKERGIVRIPIERAMDVLAERGLPKVPSRPVAGPAGPAAPEPSKEARR